MKKLFTKPKLDLDPLSKYDLEALFKPLDLIPIRTDIHEKDLLMANLEDLEQGIHYELERSYDDRLVGFSSRFCLLPNGLIQTFLEVSGSNFPLNKFRLFSGYSIVQAAKKIATEKYNMIVKYESDKYDLDHKWVIIELTTPINCQDTRDLRNQLIKQQKLFAEEVVQELKNQAESFSIDSLRF